METAAATTAARNDVEKMVWEYLALIPDPEVPVLSILELGVVRAVRFDGSRLKITITPTYTGCPAMSLFVAEIRALMHVHGIDDVEIETVYSPAWTTDWLPAEAKEKLRKYGIAPPIAEPVGHFGELPAVPCPRCGSANTAVKSEFGSTACKALYTCHDCREPFEYFKHF